MRAILSMLAVGALVGCNAIFDITQREPLADAGTGPDGSAAITELSPPEDLAKAQQSPNSIVVDAKSVYWINRQVGTTFGSLMKLDKGSSDPPVILASSLGDPVGLAQDATHLFVAANLGGGANFQDIYREDKGGGPAARFQVVSDHMLFGLTILAGELFFALQGFEFHPPEASVVALPTDPWGAGSSREIAHEVDGTLSSATLVVADSSFVYVATNGQILRLENATHGAETTFTPTDGAPKALLLDAGLLYWTEGGKVRSLPTSKPGQTPTDLALGQSNPTGLAIHGDQIYWTNTGDGSVWRASKMDGANPSAISKAEVEPLGITVDDGGAVYWTNRGDGRVRVARPR
jgi:hypothetical protein